MHAPERLFLLSILAASAGLLASCSAIRADTGVARGTHTYSEGSADIPDNDPRGFPATLTLYDPGNGSQGQIRAVKVYSSIKHPRPSDLEIVLSHPDGTNVTLHRFDPENPVAPPAAFPNSALPQPDKSLDVLAGKKMAGLWRLLVKDLRAGEIGRVERWRLEVTYAR
jgi:subtilisin-like proprotein convertase family protein